MRSDSNNGAGAGEAADGFAFGPDPRLLREGWEYRFVAAGPRLRETVELYEQLGYQVRLEPASGREVREECRDCQLVALMRYMAVYTQADPPEARK